jgi:hypothetical protein
LGILNSKVFAYYYASVSTLMRGGYFRFFSQYVEAAPIPEADPEVKNQLAELVTQRMGLETGTAEANALEQAIDAVVYGVYGLTKEEVGVVEGK